MSLIVTNVMYQHNNLEPILKSYFKYHNFRNYPLLFKSAGNSTLGWQGNMAPGVEAEGEEGQEVNYVPFELLLVSLSPKPSPKPELSQLRKHQRLRLTLALPSPLFFTTFTFIKSILLNYLMHIFKHCIAYKVTYYISQNGFSFTRKNGI